MNSTALAVIIVIFGAFTLATMAGVSGFTFGRASATDNAEKKTKAESALVGLRADILFTSKLLNFNVEQLDRYRKIAREAIAGMPDGSQKEALNQQMKEADRLLEAKVVETESYIENKG